MKASINGPAVRPEVALVEAEVVDEEKNSLHLMRGKGGANIEVNTGKGAVVIRAI